MNEYQSISNVLQTTVCVKCCKALSAGQVTFLLYDCKHVVVIQLKPQLHNQGERTRRAHPSQERGEALGIGSCLLWCAEDSRGSVKLQCKAGLAAKRSMTPSSAEGIYAEVFFYFTSHKHTKLSANLIFF